MSRICGTCSVAHLFAALEVIEKSQGIEEGFHDFLKSVVIPYSQAEGYVFSDSHEDYLVGSLARINLNHDLLHHRTKTDIAPYLAVFPSNNVYHNNLAQAIEILQCIDDAI